MAGRGTNNSRMIFLLRCILIQVHGRNICIQNIGVQLGWPMIVCTSMDVAPFRNMIRNTPKSRIVMNTVKIKCIVE